MAKKVFSGHGLGLRRKWNNGSRPSLIADYQEDVSWANLTVSNTTDFSKATFFRVKGIRILGKLGGGFWQASCQKLNQNWLVPLLRGIFHQIRIQYLRGRK